jgi:hypothetical protein
VLIGAGFAVGLVVGRWWALLASAGLGTWIALVNEVEVSGSFLGFVYAALSAIGIVLGVLLRRRIGRRKA